MQPTRDDEIRNIERLVAVSRLDWGWADLYLTRSETLLEHALPRDRFDVLRQQQRAEPELRRAIERAITRGDWREARRLAEQGTARSLLTARDLRVSSLAAEVYDASPASPSPVALALGGIQPSAIDALEGSLARLVADLRRLATEDGAWRRLYELRAAHFEAIEVHVAAGEPTSATHLREEARRAAAIGDFARVARLAEAAYGTRADVAARIHAPKASPTRTASLAEPFSPAVLEAARGCGLERLRLEAAPELDGYLGCACSASPTLPEQPLSRDARLPERKTCGHPCPPQLRGTLRDNLDLLLLHPFVTSGGTRYLPWFGAEEILVETAAEPALARPGTILERLGATRDGVSRSQLDAALLRRGVDIVEDLGLDPIEHRLVCVPFDLQVRVGARLGWANGERWTHLDGYQVTRELRLLPLVGGAARFGGPDDLCSVSPRYDAESLLARLAVVRRARFSVRETVEPGPATTD